MTTPAAPRFEQPFAGGAVVRFHVLATALFLAVCVVALGWRDRGWSEAGFVTVSLILFAVGVGTALWAYAAAVDRSRTSEVAVASLFLLAGDVAPRQVKLRMWAAWGTQIVAAMAVGIIGSTGLATGDKNVLAFGALVPMLGIGLQGLWSARHGVFPRRPGAATGKRR